MEGNTNCPIVSVKGLTPEKLVSPRFWVMRKLIVDFRQACIDGGSVEQGDLVMVIGKDGPWIVMGSDDDGFVILGNGAGRRYVIHPGHCLSAS